MSVRFAPSPTGKFHVGNLRTAWISHVFSRALGAPWIVRFEDIDRPRVVSGAMRLQLDDLRQLGMVPDEIVIQSERHERHKKLFEEAVASGQVYPCTCSRKDLQSIASAPHGEAPLYSGKCRDPKARSPGAHPTLAWRFMNPENEEGKLDFTVARTSADGGDFVPSYHWACAIDDFDGGYALLVRASDLALAARLQKRVYAWVAAHEEAQARYPSVFHAALITSNDGSRLEKRTQGVTLDEILKTGIMPKDLLRRLDASFDRSLIGQFAPGRVWGESRERMTLGEIGILLEIDRAQ